MSLLSDNEINRKSVRMVSAWIPVKTHTYMTLYCLARGTSKARISKELLENWRKQQVDDETELIKDIVDRAIIQLRAKQSIDPAITYEQYAEKLEDELRRKEVRPTHLKIILTKLNTAWKERRHLYP